MWKQSNQRANQTQWIVKNGIGSSQRKARDPDLFGVVIGLINRFLANIRMHQSDREGGALTSRKL